LTTGTWFTRGIALFADKTTTLRAYGQTDIGQHREQNEDSFLVAEELGLYGVADGIGGLPYGDQASRLALDCIHHWGTENGGIQTEDDLRSAILYANETVCEEGAILSDDTGIGTTVSLIVLKEKHVMIGNVGDSGCFLFRKGNVAKLTRDHTLAQEIYDQIAPGEKKPEVPDYFHHSLTRCLGQTDDFKSDIFSYEIKSGDRFLACTDGVTDLINQDELHNLVFNSESPKEFIDQVISTALKRGGHDNTTAVAIFT
jgi:serine/threonine protein phosphatase PrpC